MERFETQVDRAVAANPEIEELVRRLESEQADEHRARAPGRPLGRHDRPRLPALPAPARRRRGVASGASLGHRDSHLRAPRAPARGRGDLRRCDAHPATFDLEGWSYERWLRGTRRGRRRGRRPVPRRPSTKVVRCSATREAGRSRTGPPTRPPARPRSTSPSGRAVRASAVRCMPSCCDGSTASSCASRSPASVSRTRRATGCIAPTGSSRSAPSATSAVKLGRAWDVRWYQRPLRP